MSDNMSNKMINNGEILLSNELEKNKIYKFEDIEEIKENLLRGIFSCDFDYPSELQSYVLKSMFNKKDIFIQSNAGTGKTTACVITSLQVIDESVNKPQVLILNPRTELALCSYNSIKKIATYLMTEDNFLLAIGGTNRKDNILKMGGIVKNEKSDVDNVAKIVLGTFGRIDDLISNYPHLFDSIKLLIVDDCDEIINCCLKENFQSILTKLKSGYQLCMLTTSLSEETKTIVDNLMENSLKIFHIKNNLIISLTKQTYIITKKPLEIIKEIISNFCFSNYIIYVNSNNKIKEVKEYFDSANLSGSSDFTIYPFDSNTEKNQIYSTIDNLSHYSTNGIVSTDILLNNRANIQKINLIFNLDLPKNNYIENYIYRIGSNYHGIKKRLVINLLSDESELDIIKKIQSVFKVEITEFKNKDFEHIK